MKTRLAIAIKLYIASVDVEQKDLAAAWKVSQSTVTRFLSGEAMPEAPTMLRILCWMLERRPDNHQP